MDSVVHGSYREARAQIRGSLFYLHHYWCISIPENAYRDEGGNIVTDAHCENE